MVCAPQPTHVAAYCASRRSLKPGGDLRTPICSWRCFRSARQLAQRLGVSPFIRGGGGRRCCRRGMCSSLLYVYSGLPLSSKRLLLLGPSLAIGGFSVDLALFAPLFGHSTSVLVRRLRGLSRAEQTQVLPQLRDEAIRRGTGFSSILAPR